MKTLKTITLISIVSVGMMYSVFAVQGTCSYHRGVNCSSGADWDGSAICNDGWRDSTERFSDVSKCHPNRHICTSDEMNSLKLKYKLFEQEKQVKDLTSKLSELNYKAKLIPYTYPEVVKKQGRMVTERVMLGEIERELRLINLEVITVSAQLDAVYSKYVMDSNLINDECYALGEQNYNKNLLNSTLNQTQYKTQQVEVPVLIEGGYIRGAELFCDNGYNKDVANLKCIKDGLVAICSQSSNSNGNITTCSCSSGYKWIGGKKCKKYNTQTGEFIEDVSTTTQPIMTTTSALNNIGTSSFTRTLKKGMSGDDVRQLQILLQKLNYLPSSQTPSTYFGSITSNALIKFQRDNKIQPSTGSFGPTTQAKLISLIKG
jgi:hypothetical protein